MIIDAHIHLWNRLHGDDSGVDRQQLTWGRAREGDKVYYCCPPSFEDSLSTYQRALANMDCHGVERSVVLQEFMDGGQDAYLAEVRKVEPKRFSCTALFDKPYYDDPMGCFKLAIEERKLQGFLVKTPSPFVEVATQKLKPMWQACAERGLPVVLKNGAPAEIRRLLAMAPGIKVVLSHFAGSFGPRDEFEERIRIAQEHERVYLDAGAITYRQRYPAPRAQEMMQHAIERVGAKRIAWGSDYPRPGLVVDMSYKQQIEFITIECAFLAEEQKAQILGKTALEIYLWD